MSILIIDAETGHDASWRNYFSEQGFHQLQISRTAEDARNFIQENNDNNIIGEINLIIISKTPDASRFKLCREMRENDLVKFAYVMLIISSLENKTEVTKSQKCKADDYAVKPYSSKIFTKKMMLFCYRRAALLVEDDPVNRSLVSSILSKRNVEVISASDGTEAYNLINGMTPPRLVIMDIGLPGMSGIKLVAHIRNKAIWKNTPILMLTASGDILDVKKSLSNGANDYMAKPFEMIDFVKRMNKYFPPAEI